MSRAPAGDYAVVADASLARTLAPIFEEHLKIFACPDCGGEIKLEGAGLCCWICGRAYPIAGGIPQLLAPRNGPDDTEDVTETVRAFYEDAPFPNYDDLDSRETLVSKARRSVFAALLEEQMPPGALVLEAGCGTGQLSNFLGMSWKRRVFGADLCLHSLRLAQQFRDRFEINNAGFLQMNLFRPPFRTDVFDVIVANGVLHHTSDPRGGFESLVRMLKPGGVIIVGLYNTLARIPTLLRGALFRRFGERLYFLDARLREGGDSARRRSWLLDQYHHPHESRHSYDEILGWFDDHRIDFLAGAPTIAGASFGEDTQLFEPHPRGNRIDRFLTQVEMLLKGGKDGGLFIMIGRKRSSQHEHS